MQHLVRASGQRIAQEEIAECLKRIRHQMVEFRLSVKRAWFDGFQYTMPPPIASRVAHIRRAQPINVTEALQFYGEPTDAFVDSLKLQVRSSMQEALDDLNQEVSKRVDPFCRLNPFYTLL